MTFEKFFKDKLVSMGMFDSQAQSVISEAKDDKALESFTERWSDEMEGCPTQMKVVVWLSVKQAALKWIDANLPKAWYRQMFAD